MDHPTSPIDTTWGEKTGRGATEAEWVELVRSLPQTQARTLSDLVERHRHAFVSLFYERLMHNRDASVFLSQKIVQERLHNSLSNWLTELFQSSPGDVDAFVTKQRKIGEVHARIDVPIHVVMQGARLLKNEIISKLVKEISDRGTLAHLIMYVGAVIDIATEIMSQAFVKDTRESAQTDEAYRAFTLSHDFPLERESQRAALMEWSQSVLFNLYGNVDTPLLPLAGSDFGLWLQHKADLMFSNSSTLENIRRNVRHIDDILLPVIGDTRKDNPAALASLLTAFQTKIGEMKFLLSELFQAAATMETGRDPLTRTLNRRFMPSILTREVRMASQKHMDLSVLMIDIDHFKRINDTYGHAAGDAVLQQVAEAILSFCRSSDFVFRYGGEEFLVALVEADGKKAFRVAEELRQRITRQPLNLPDGDRQRVTLSIGIATFNGHPDYSHLIDAADRALYRAKRAGRNRCESGAPLSLH